MSKTAAALSLCSFRAAGVDAFQAGQDLPTRLVVAPWGTHDARGRGKVIIDQTTLSTFAASQKALRLDDQVALDFDHNTVEGTPAFKADKEPRLVAAFGTPSVEDGVAPNRLRVGHACSGLPVSGSGDSGNEAADRPAHRGCDRHH